MTSTMDQSSVTSTDDVLVTLIRCPSWCTARTTDEVLTHEPFTQNGRRLIHHGGEPFGRFWVQQNCDAETGEVVSVVAGGMDVDDANFDAAGLRQLAVEAIAAAEWIEGLR